MLKNGQNCLRGDHSFSELQALDFLTFLLLKHTFSPWLLIESRILYGFIMFSCLSCLDLSFFRLIVNVFHTLVNNVVFKLHLL